ncbi:MBL fold metallo-hydrolase [Jannaschia donghaensis]|uniref:Ribonuclease Z n=1 Tax=Jannaschia donghaensis TaxID=420998 RepID=A0A0M6YNK0_9RHOB|nr:MBL fold metallo-hydrolase [Jannaschia donghaensis]CTQ51429.1 ribonuclease Z [Jannaschia donghaensis]
MTHPIKTATALLALTAGPALAANCLEITITGVQGGPPVFAGQAGSGTLVTYGTEENACRDVLMQFDTGRGTTQQLSKIGVPVARLSAVFLTHMHSDHVEGLVDLSQLRWHFNSTGPKLPLICAEDTDSPAGHTMSCVNFATHIGDALINSGEMAQRLAENADRLPGGPADLLDVATFSASDTAGPVWTSGDVTVTAAFSRHVAGHASYRVDTPAGSVVIGGDAGNDTPQPPRDSSTSAQVEALAEGADVIVHSTIHPVMGSDGTTGFPPAIYHRQSTAEDLGAMAQRTGASHLMLTHLIPPVGAARQGIYPLPAPLTAADYATAATDGGYTGTVVVGADLATLRLVAE